MTSTQYRQVARSALKGNWGAAIAVLVVASLIVSFLSGIINQITSLLFIPTLAEIYETIRYFTSSIDIVEFFNTYAVRLSLISLLTMLITLLVQSLANGVLGLGTAQFNLDVVTRWQSPRFETLFSKFNIYGKALLLDLLINLFTMLWSLLFVIPGIIAGYRYAMARYLLAQNPAMSAMDAIRASKRLMRGHKMELFVLDISFIGWYLLALPTFGLITLYVSPYHSVAQATFYLDLTGQLNRQQVLYGYQSFNGPTYGQPMPPPYYPYQGGGSPPPYGYGQPYQPPYGAPQPPPYSPPQQQQPYSPPQQQQPYAQPQQPPPYVPPAQGPGGPAPVPPPGDEPPK